VLAPEGHAARIGAAVRSSCRMAGLATAEIATRWIEDGAADRMADFQHQEARARQEIAGRLLKGIECDTKPDSFHLWLHLPEPWRADEFTAHARARNVIVLPAAFFTVGRAQPPHAVRLCLGATRERDQVEKGLGIIADILASRGRAHRSRQTKEEEQRLDATLRARTKDLLDSWYKVAESARRCLWIRTGYRRWKTVAKACLLASKRTRLKRGAIVRP